MLWKRTRLRFCQNNYNLSTTSLDKLDLSSGQIKLKGDRLMKFFDLELEK
jgi:hypothetical protein